MDIVSLALISRKHGVTRPPELRLIVSFPTWEKRFEQLEAAHSPCGETGRYDGVKKAGMRPAQRGQLTPWTRSNEQFESTR